MKKKCKFTKVELKKILTLLKSKDEEAQVLGYSLYQNSGFRKYIRNKCYFCIDDPKQKIYSFSLTSLNMNSYKHEFKEYSRKRKNSNKILLLISIIKCYINNEMIIYDYSYFKQRRNK